MIADVQVNAGGGAGGGVGGVRLSTATGADLPRAVSIPAAARILGIGLREVYDRIDAGELHAVRGPAGLLILLAPTRRPADTPPAFR